MKKITLLLLLVSYFSFSQSLVKTYYDPYSKTKLKELYQVKPNTNIINGYYKSYDKYGNLLVHRNYTNNKQNGTSTSYYGANEASLMSNNIREKCLGAISGVFNYKNNQLDGIQNRYDYSDKGIRFLKYKQVYQSGTEIESYEYYPNKILKQHNKLNGVCNGFYENGQKFEEFTLVNGIYQGKYTYWYKSGKLLEQGQMIDNEKNGEWLEYNEDGTIKAKQMYDLGKRLPTEEEKEAELDRVKQLEEEEVKNAEFLKSRREKSVLDELKSSYQLDLQIIARNYKNGAYKPTIYDAFDKIKNQVLKYIEYDDVTNQEKIEAIELGMKFNKKINRLLNEPTRKLENKLEKLDDLKDIVNLIEMEN